MVFRPLFTRELHFWLTVDTAGYPKESLDLSETSVNVGTFVKGKVTSP